MNRRKFLKFLLLPSLILTLKNITAMAHHNITEKINYTNAKWKQILSPAQFNILRKEGTEPPFSSPLNNEKRKGVFICAGCELPLFDSNKKYDSKTGWPSFWETVHFCVSIRT